MPSTRKKAVSRSRPKKTDLVICLILVIINLFTLPSATAWSYYGQPSIIDQKLVNNRLFEYRHPPIPSVAVPAPAPYLSAISYILIDANTNTILLSKDKDIRIYPASTTKLATAITALNIYPLDESITINQKYDNGKVMNLQLGQRFTVRSLVDAIIVFSANDAAYHLANHHSGGVNGFVADMNLLMNRYSLTNTHFTNFDGIHNSNHYSTVSDLAQLARISIKNQAITGPAILTQQTVQDIEGTSSYSLKTTNELLGVVQEIEGLKTGWTPEASGSFIGLININGHKLISVVAQSQDRFNDTRLIVDWAKQNLTWSTYQ